MTYSGSKTIRSAAEALAARYGFEPWFRRVSVLDGGLVLHVHGCPFATHREIEGFGVEVRSVCGVAG